MRYLRFVLTLIAMTSFGISISSAEEWLTYENRYHGFQFKYPKTSTLNSRYDTRFTRSGQVVFLTLKMGDTDVHIDVDRGDFSPGCGTSGECDDSCQVKSRTDVVGGDFKGVLYIVDRITECVDLPPQRAPAPPVFAYDIGNKKTLVFHSLYRSNQPMPLASLQPIMNSLKSIPVAVPPSAAPSPTLNGSWGVK